MIPWLKKHRWFTLAGILLLALAGWGAYLHFARGWGWAAGTGFTEKTLWDWLELLIIPLVLALGAFWLERSERISDRRIAKERFEQEQKLADIRRLDDQAMAKDQQRETALQAYIDKMTELLLAEHHPLRRSSPEDEERVVARTRTLATLSQLDPERKGALVRFLYEAQLIFAETPKPGADRGKVGGVDYSIISLNGADLRAAQLCHADLLRVDLSQALLNGADFSGTALAGADLYHANLQGARFCGADLLKTRLTGADCSGADFSEANLGECNLTNAQLPGANLANAKLAGANLNNADLSGANLAGAILYRTDLTKADLTKSILHDSRLIEAKLFGANLTGADLSQANLSGANLSRTILYQANLCGTALLKADFSYADLSEVILDEDGHRQLLKAKSLEHAIMPDGQIYDPAVHGSRKPEEVKA